MDGLATGIALIAAVGIGISLMFRQLPGDVLLLVGFAGACFGFLRYNFYPASIFLGDTGSLFIGFTLAALTISTSSKGTAIAAIGMPLLAVGIPLFDSVLAVWRRSIRRLLQNVTQEGKKVSIDQGDADHLHHRLLRSGRTQRHVAWLFYIATGLLTTTGILTTVFKDKVLGILGVAFVITMYTIVRHLVWIELKDTGEVVLRGIARPVRRNLTLLVYIVLDLVVLNLAWLASYILLDLQDGSLHPGLKLVWLRSFPIDILIPFLLLLGFRTYSLVWSLASVVDYMKIWIAGGMGCFLTCAIHLLISPSNEALWSVILRQILFFGMTVPVLCGSRAVSRFIQDAMLRHDIRLRNKQAAGQRILLAGCGHDLLTFLNHSTLKDFTRHRWILSNDESLRGCYICGIPVVGTYYDLAALIKTHPVDAVYRIGHTEHTELLRWSDILKQSGVRLVHWDVIERDVSTQ